MSIRRPASRNRAGAAASSSSRTVRPPAWRPTSCGIYANVPMSTSPSSAGNSPASTRNSVDLPTPLAPTNPTCCPGVILNDTSANSRSPPGWAYARLETTTCDIAESSLTRRVTETQHAACGRAGPCLVASVYSPISVGAASAQPSTALARALTDFVESHRDQFLDEARR